MKYKKISVGVLLLIILTSVLIGQKAGTQPLSWEQFLRNSAVENKVIDTFIDPNQPTWAQFDSELGYILGSYLPRDGLDGSLTISTSQPDGTRTARLYTDKRCRINAYGNSFTQCHQVSDGETWEEYLAAHLGEPIRNFGMGGYGVYQSYRRMLREEGTDKKAEYVLFYIWGDDHLRSLWRCRHVAIYKWWDHDGGRMFHNPFWPNVEMDLESGRLLEKENLLPTEEALYKMTGPDFMYQSLKDDLALQMHSYTEGLITEIDLKSVSLLAKHLEIEFDTSKKGQDLQLEVKKILEKYGFTVTRFILDKVRRFTESQNKKLMVILFDPYRAMQELIKSGTRYDQGIVDYLEENEFNYFDMNEVHREDFKDFKIPLDQYMKRYFIGHYSPAGNHFFAFSIKQKIVDWLDPKPITYQKGDQRQIDFQDYLPGH